MLHKLLWLAVSSGIAKKIYDHYARRRVPFPTARRHPARTSPAPGLTRGVDLALDFESDAAAMAAAGMNHRRLPD